MSKLFCKECNLIYDEKEIEKLHKQTNLLNHHYIKENNSLEIMSHLCQKIRNLEAKINESYKVESELLYMIQENRLLINLFRGESQISIVHPEFELLNCKANQDKEKSACVMFRSKNIVYITIVFDGKIEETKDTGKAQIILKMPMWLIYSGSFIVESLFNCLSEEKKIVRLCVKYEQFGNEIILNINQSDLDIQTYWMKSRKYSSFTIKGNFMIQPPSRRRLGKYYIYHITTDKVVTEKNGTLSLIKNWKSGCLLEIYEENNQEKIKIANKFPNIINGSLILESKEKNEKEIRYIPGYSDIIQIVLFKDKKPMFIEADGDNITLAENSSEKSQFMIIPELTKK
jgi:hypothetical protein